MSASTAEAMSGYCSLQATSAPPVAARWTWPSDAAAAAARSKRSNRAGQSGPSSVAMRRLTKAQPIGGALAWSCASSAAYSRGRASGMVDMSCATFMSGPFSPPSARRSSSAWRWRSAVRPSTRPPAIRAARPPAAVEMRA